MSIASSTTAAGGNTPATGAEGRPRGGGARARGPRPRRVAAVLPATRVLHRSRVGDLRLARRGRPSRRHRRPGCRPPGRRRHEVGGRVAAPGLGCLPGLVAGLCAPLPRRRARGVPRDHPRHRRAARRLGGPVLRLHAGGLAGLRRLRAAAAARGDGPRPLQPADPPAPPAGGRRDAAEHDRRGARRCRRRHDPADPPAPRGQRPQRRRGLRQRDGLLVGLPRDDRGRADPRRARGRHPRGRPGPGRRRRRRQQPGLLRPATAAVRVAARAARRRPPRLAGDHRGRRSAAGAAARRRGCRCSTSSGR